MRKLASEEYTNKRRVQDVKKSTQQKEAGSDGTIPEHGLDITARLEARCRLLGHRWTTRLQRR